MTDLRAALLCLASDACDCLTGHNLVIDGGQSLRVEGADEEMRGDFSPSASFWDYSQMQQTKMLCLSMQTCIKPLYLHTENKRQNKKKTLLERFTAFPAKYQMKAWKKTSAAECVAAR